METPAVSSPDKLLRPPVNSSADEMRLLDIFPSEIKSSPIACSYRVISLKPSDGQQLPFYETSSYAWQDAGSDPETEAPQILIDHTSFPVSASLLRALRRLRFPNRIRTIWIDAVCINQSDNVEKTQQVNFMRRIYASCTHCNIWAGISTRLWTVQEAILPPAATVYWGACEMSWHLFDMASEAIMGPTDGRRDEHVGDLMPDEFNRLQLLNYLTCLVRGISFSSAGEEPVSTLYRWRDRKSTDLRDKVYGLMGLKGRAVGGEEEEEAAFLPGIPSCGYTLDAQTLFCRVSWALVKQSNSLQPLMGRRGEGAKLEGLPSWVIDWSQDRWSDGFFYFDTEERKVPVQVPEADYWAHKPLYYHYCADGPVMVGGGPRLLDEGGRVLGLDGFLVDRIAVVEQREVLGRQRVPDGQVLAASAARYGELMGQCHEYFSSASEESRRRWLSGRWMQKYLGVVTGKLDAANPGAKVGLGPVTSEPGDEVWILELCRLPVVLKPLKSEDQEGEGANRCHVTWVGDCCVYGIMMGGAVKGKEDAWVEVAVH
ncbi:heterokaryon incompatibility protein-domain-containing protein [Neurospora crassa]|nr:heterokaryon incompatibility protein-domain-containing protein [Neurospora crassa]